MHEVAILGILIFECVPPTDKVSNYSYCRLSGVLLVNVIARDSVVS